MNRPNAPISKLYGTAAVLVLTALSAIALLGSREELDPVRLVPDLPADVELKGNSSVKRWTCAGDDIDAVFETDLSKHDLHLLVRDFLREHARGGDIPRDLTAGGGGALRAYVEIRPKLLDCGNSRMERDLQKAVRADDYPVISYWFSGVEGAIRPMKESRGTAFQMEVSGTLELANTVREVVHTARVRIISADEFEVSGRLPLRMTDFQIDPPSALLGLVRAHDEIEVTYRFVLRPSTISAPIPARARPSESDKS